MKIVKAAFVCVLAMAGAAQAGDLQAFSTQSLMLNLDAVAELPMTGGMSRYRQLSAYFNQAIEPSEQTLTGWWSGRCYAQATPNQAIGMILMAATVTHASPSDDGPLFPPEESLKTFNLALAQRTDRNVANEFDHLTDQNRGLIQSFVSGSQFINDLIASRKEGSLVAANTAGNLGYSVRAYQQYFIAKTTILRNDQDFKAGQTYTMCYFFKKVH